MKKIITLFFVLVVIFAVVPAAYASPCCELDIESITQIDDVVTVNYGYMNNFVTDREIELTVTPKNSWKTEVEESHYVSDWTGNGSFTFSSKEMLNGSIYTVKVYYTAMCNNYYCSTGIGETVNITIEGGKPVFKFEELINGKLEPVGASVAYLSVTASTSGFYSLSAVTYEDGESYQDYMVDIRTYPNNGYVSYDSITYMSKGQTATYLVSSRNGKDLSTNIAFKQHTPIVVAPITTNLQNTTKVFALSGVKGINEITIPKYGFYDFTVSGCEEYESTYTILDENGNIMDYAYGELKSILEAGTYYINTNGLGDDYALDITYTVPESMEFGKAYTAAPNEELVFKLNVTAPSVVTFTGDNATIRNEDNVYGFYEGEATEVVVPGEYFVTVRNDSEENSSWSFAKQTMPSIPLGVSSKPEVETTYRKYIAFCAPEDGKYEFDFSKCSDYNIETSDDYTSVTYYVIEMEKDEWFMVSVYTDDSEVTVRKYVGPTEISLEFDKAEYFDYYSGKTYLYSYTPDEDGDFKIVSSNNYCDNMKIYTDDEVLYSTTSADWKFSKIVKMKKGVKVCIELSGESTIGGDVSQNDIKVTNAYTELTNGATISLSTSDDLTMCYTPSEEGFYNVLISAMTGGWRGADVKINEEESNYVDSSNPFNTAVYCTAGGKIYFTFYRYSGAWCDVTVNISKITPTPVEEVESNLVANTYYSFTPSKNGIHIINRDTNYGNIKIMSESGKNISFGSPEAVYFNGEAGVTYILMPYENMNAKISLADATSVNIGEKYSAGTETKAFSFEVPESGYYKIDTSLCNSEIYVWGGDFWYSVSNTFNYMHKLDKGIFPIMYLPAANNETGTPSKAQFTVTKCENSEKLGVSVDDLFMSFSYESMEAAVRLTVTAPYEIDDVKVGIEYKGAGLDESQTVASPEMKFSDKHYIQATVSELEEGRTYTIKPYIYIGDDSENKIYGEEKTFTLKMRSDIKKIRNNSYKFEAEGRDKYNRYGKEYIFEFTQPENSTAETEINYNSVLSNINIYDANGTQLDFEWLNSGKKVALTGGQKYYLVVSSYNDGLAEINITSLPEAEEASPYSVGIDSSSTSEITCKISGSGAEEPALYAAFYQGKKLVGIRMIENPSAEEKVDVDASLGADTCKIFLADNIGFMPLCENEEISLK